MYIFFLKKTLLNILCRLNYFVLSFFFLKKEKSSYVGSASIAVLACERGDINNNLAFISKSWVFFPPDVLNTCILNI